MEKALCVSVGYLVSLICSVLCFTIVKMYVKVNVLFHSV